MFYFCILQQATLHSEFIRINQAQFPFQITLIRLLELVFNILEKWEIEYNFMLVVNCKGNEIQYYTK